MSSKNRMAMLYYEDIFDCVFVLCLILLRNGGGNNEKVFPLRMKRMKEREREKKSVIAPRSTMPTFRRCRFSVVPSAYKTPNHSLLVDNTTLSYMKIDLNPLMSVKDIRLGGFIFKCVKRHMPLCTSYLIYMFRIVSIQCLILRIYLLRAWTMLFIKSV